VTNVFQARAQGFDMQIVGMTSVESERNPTGPNNGLVVKDTAIKTGKDLEGKTVGTLALRSGAQAWVDKTGGDPQKVKRVETPMPQGPQAVASGRVDAFQTTEPFRTQGPHPRPQGHSLFDRAQAERCGGRPRGP
jgi:NitT/TauT family transport system substrate-binding protein